VAIEEGIEEQVRAARDQALSARAARAGDDAAGQEVDCGRLLDSALKFYVMAATEPDDAVAGLEIAFGDLFWRDYKAGCVEPVGPTAVHPRDP
jgi:hypothetical protein